MTLSLKHTFTSPKTDGADPTQVQPSNWNAEHTITVQAPAIIGRSAAGAGAVSALSLVPVELGGTGASTLTGLVRGNGTGAFTAVTAPTGAVVGTTDTQTLTNKTLTTPVLSGTASGTTAGRLGYASGVLSFGNGSAQRTVFTLEDNQTVTSTNVFGNASGQTFLASTTTAQDGLTVVGRAGGTGSFRVTLSPGTLTANRAVSFGDFAGTVVIDTAAQTLTNKTLTSPTINGGTITGARETRVVLASGAIDLATGDYFTRTISGAQTFSLSNVPTSGLAQAFILDLTNGGSATITWWANLRWPGGTAPTLTAAGRDVLAFYTHDGGANWSGFVLGRDVK